MAMIKTIEFVFYDSHFLVFICQSHGVNRSTTNETQLDTPSIIGTLILPKL